jgi:curved DNA-binding protein CbpA
VTDYYKILGVGPKSSEKEITKAYRNLAKKFHPDKNPNDALATKKFQDIQTAYEILIDPIKRAAFDSEYFNPHKKSPAKRPAFDPTSHTTNSIPHAPAYESNEEMQIWQAGMWVGVCWGIYMAYNDPVFCRLSPRYLMRYDINYFVNQLGTGIGESLLFMLRGAIPGANGTTLSISTFRNLFFKFFYQGHLFYNSWLI